MVKVALEVQYSMYNNVEDDAFDVDVNLGNIQELVSSPEYVNSESFNGAIKKIGVQSKSSVL